MDRLLTAFYLPANLLAVTTMVASHGRLGARLRVVGGFLGFAAAISVVAVVSRGAALGKRQSGCAT